jgi:hypothetical protein
LYFLDKVDIVSENIPMQIPTLSNRTIAFFLLGLIIVMSYWGIRYVFFLNVGTLRFKIVDEAKYTVVIKRATVEIRQIDCAVSCSFEQIPAGTYEYVATAPGRLSISNSVQIFRNQVVTETLE